ncbi:Tail fiber protein [Escherichia coli]|uniref:Tail fiber protein n=1 Tax=Escherichia coli TaxID=562 RepID=A0A376U770_ECOLX|nr:Tail fiber protein [Escherichia coli]
MIIHAPTQRKIKNADGQQGNVLVRSMLMEYSGAREATEINTPAETWQIDFTARLVEWMNASAGKISICMAQRHFLIRLSGRKVRQSVFCHKGGGICRRIACRIARKLQYHSIRETDKNLA